MLKAINASDAQRIQSAQVITSLLDAAKELLENALDAAATKISLKFTNNGLDVLEVIDNGSGIKESEFEMLVMKHATSKLSTFEDLDRLSTLGFRGEALSALCHLSHLKIITCTKETYPAGFAVDYDHDGSMKSKKRVSAQVGTTIRLEELFVTLPVRRKDFIKNAKRDLIKASKMLQAYAAIQVGVRIEALNFSGPAGKNRAHLLGSSGTLGRDSLLKNLGDLFGSRLSGTLICIDSELTYQGAHQVQNSYTTIKIVGYVSSPQKEYGGRPDRQLIYINSRPCQLQQVCRVVNEVFSSIGSNRNPFMLINLVMPPDSYDVNVSPDKRTIFLHDEAVILDHIRQNIVNLFTKDHHEMPTSTTILEAAKDEQPFSNLAHRFLLSSTTRDTDAPVEHTSRLPVTDEEQLIVDVNHQPEPMRSKHDSTDTESQSDVEMSPPSDVIQEVQERVTEARPSGLEPLIAAREVHTRGPNKTLPMKRKRSAESARVLPFGRLHLPTDTDPAEKDPSSDRRTVSSPLDNSEDVVVDSDGESKAKDTKTANHSRPAETPDEAADETGESEKPLKKPMLRFAPRLNGLSHSPAGLHVHDLHVTLDYSEVLLQAQESVHVNNVPRDTNAALEHAGVDDDSKVAEEALTLSIKKSDFFGMDVVGQFNLGFILVLHNHEIFIIDQHASDEKSNYERLLRETVIQSQRLAVPKELELSAIERLSIDEHLETLAKNGFEVTKCCASDEQDAQYLLTALPVSRNITFKASDLLEILHSLIDGAAPGSVRCVKARRMFASRACRSSIMIGTALSKERMQHVVWHLGELEAPWNCPHGRPTMRHLVNVHAMSTWKSDYE